MSLTQKQEGFCLDYIETGNASEAYRSNYGVGSLGAQTINREAKALLDNHKTRRTQETCQRNHAVPWHQSFFDVKVS